jgi:hypothetical protein
MAKMGRSKSNRSTEDRLEKIKRLAVIAMFSDDDLLERLVLKGGNALNLAHHVTTRASVDLDFSMEKEFAFGELGSICHRVEHRLRQTFAPVGYTVFDVKLDERPERVTSDVADFWGGYRLDFKLIDTKKAAELGGALEEIRRNAIPVGLRNRTRFEIDISKFEYCIGKQETKFDGYTIYVYTPPMIVCEKLRAICQQMPEYLCVVKSSAAPRARDFLDIHDTIQRFSIDLTSASQRELLANVFAAKRVPLTLLGQIQEHRDFHRLDWLAVEASVSPGVELQPFDFYFDFVANLARLLKPLRDV